MEEELIGLQKLLIKASMETYSIKYRRELPSLMKRLGLPMVAAELGCAEGLNANDLLANGIDMLVMVDNWEKIEGITGDGNFDSEFHNSNYAQAMDRIEKYGSRVKVLRGLTTEMAIHIENKVLGLVYVDAAHDYNSVKNDISAWFPKLVVGGIMAFHDHENIAYGVKQAVKEFAEANGLKIFLIPEDRLDDAGAFFFKK